MAVLLKRRIGYKLIALFGALSFTLAQIVVFAIWSNLQLTYRLDYDDDLTTLNDVCAEIGAVLFVFEPTVLRRAQAKVPASELPPTSVVTLAADVTLFTNSTSIHHQVIPTLVSHRFMVEIFYDDSIHARYSKWPTAIVLKKTSVTFVIKFLHELEDTYWWFGNLRSDSSFQHKISPFNIDQSVSHARDGLLARFQSHKMKLAGFELSNIWIPKHSTQFIDEYKNSMFLDCNRTRAKQFEHFLKQPDRKKSINAIHFTHKVMKLLFVVKTVLDRLKIPFWISSGTCLGYFRHCSVIPHSKDVDIGVFATDFSHSIISGLESRNIMLHLWFGELNDSLELSFLSSSSLKLDIFFFFQEGDTVWNGGTQLKTGKKFKYIFPKFDLCWTIFLGLKVRIPCETEMYIKSNYGSNWSIPMVNWDWKTNPHNVQENGVWPLDKRKHVIKMYK